MSHPTTIAVGDCHFPFSKRKTVKAILSLIRKVKPKRIVQLGDLYDLYSYSRFARSYNVLTPQQEIKLGRKDAEAFWAEARAAAGRGVECFQIIGNHDERIVKKAMGLLPEMEHLLGEVNHLWRFKGVEVQGSERDELILDGVCYMHGYRKFGDHVKHNLMSTVCGHLHLGAVSYMRLGQKTLWELNAGYCADESTVPMSYSRQNKFSKHTQGVGLIDSYGPRFIPLG
jgi:metallophosphoesterase superfamily enzyme